jgi:hypothetical protein
LHKSELSPCIWSTVHVCVCVCVCARARTCAHMKGCILMHSHSHLHTVYIMHILFPYLHIYYTIINYKPRKQTFIVKTSIHCLFLISWSSTLLVAKWLYECFCPAMFLCHLCLTAFSFPYEKI